MPILGPLVKRAYELGRLPEIAKPKVDAYTAQKKVLKKLLQLMVTRRILWIR